MAGTELIIDDEYCESMRAYFVERGKNIDSIINSYIKILKKIKDFGILEGETSDALQAYINNASRLQNMTGNISGLLARQVRCFLEEVDIEDSYLF